MLQQIGASHLHKPAAESHNSRTAGGASEGPFSAITQALICVVTKEILVLASVILFIYCWNFVISWYLIGRGTQIY